MTTDQEPKVNNPSEEDGGMPAPRSAAEQVIKNAAINSESKGGRKLKFVPESHSAKVVFLVGGAIGLIIILLVIILLLSGGRSSTNKNTTSQSTPVVIKDLDPDNNSDGYIQSPPADFGQFSLNLNYPISSMIKSANYEAKIAEQVSWPDGFSILVANIDRDYRPASEFDYKKITEAGDELVRVNILVGNATNANMPIGYSDLQLYAENSELGRVEPERISEDTYSPVEGQLLGGKQTKKLSLHFSVKRGQEFSITKTKTFIQNNAKVKDGEEKKPVLNLKINL